MSDPQNMTREQIETALRDTGLPFESIQLIHKDRHNPSPLLVVIIKLHEDTPLAFMVLTEIAGIFETPLVEVRAESKVERQGDGPDEMFADTWLTLKVRWS